MEVAEGEYFELAASYDPTAFEFRVTWNGHWVGAYHIPSQDNKEWRLSSGGTTASGAMDIYYLGFTIEGELLCQWKCNSGIIWKPTIQRGK